MTLPGACAQLAGKCDLTYLLALVGWYGDLTCSLWIAWVNIPGPGVQAEFPCSPWGG